MGDIAKSPPTSKEFAAFNDDDYREERTPTRPLKEGPQNNTNNKRDTLQDVPASGRHPTLIEMSSPAEIEEELQRRLSATDIPAVAAKRKSAGPSESELAVIAEEIYNMAKSANYDPTTGLYKRDALARMYNRLLEHLRPNEQLVVVAFDIDYFKRINETIGHGQADAVLKNIGETILKQIAQDVSETLNKAVRIHDVSIIRERDAGSRTGGDEFVIILNHIPLNHDAMIKIIHRILSRISDITWKHENEVYPVTVSAGCAPVQWSTDGQYPTFKEISEKADKSAGITKQLGRNGLVTIEGDTYFLYKFTGEIITLEETGPVSELGHSLKVCQHKFAIITDRWADEIFLIVNDEEARKRLGSLPDEGRLLIGRFLEYIRGKKTPQDAFTEFTGKEMPKLLYYALMIRDKINPEK